MAKLSSYSQDEPQDHPAFEGRERELEDLERAFARTHEGELSVVLVSGESGMGKTQLVREMAQRQRKRDPNTWVLSGICQEHGGGPYQAFEGAVDALSRALGRLNPDICAALLPKRAFVMTQIFPSLGDVPTLARASHEFAPTEPFARRLHAFSLLGNLLGRLSERHPIILTIDDLQWADEDSMRLLRSLLEHREPPPIMIVCTLLPDAELSAAMSEHVDLLRKKPCTRVLELGGLPTLHGQALAQRLLGDAGLSQRSRKIVSESAGNPLLISELSELANSDLSRPHDVSEWAGLRARVAALPELARALLERVSLCTRPQPELFFEELLEQGDTLREAVKLLLAHKLLVREGAVHLTCFHERVRTITRAAITSDRLATLHGEIAAALDSEPYAETHELAYHWDRSNEPEKACAPYKQAGDTARERLAFSFAAHAYGRAIALKGNTGDTEGARLLLERAHALSRAGWATEAAALYAQAADQAEGAERVRLSVAAARYQLQIGLLEEGLSRARTILGELGITLPKGATAAVARVAWDRAMLKLRGVDASDAAGTPSLREQLELDAMFQLSVPVSWVDMLPGHALGMRYVQRAISLSEPAHLARALGIEAALRALKAPAQSDTYLPLLARTRELALQAEDPALQGEVEWLASNVAIFRGDLAHAEESLEAAHELLTMRSDYDPWLILQVRTNLGQVFGLRGHYRRLARDIPAWIADAEERRDRATPSGLIGIGCGHLPYLMEDDPDGALSALSRVMTFFSGEAFTPAHHGELIATTQAHLYGGGDLALRFLDEHEARHDRAALHQTRFLSASLRVQRASALLCAAADANAEGRRALFLRVERTLQGLELSDASFSGHVALSMHGQLAAARGERELATRYLDASQKRFESNGMQGYAKAIQYLLAALEGGEATQKRRDGALRFFQEQGFKNPWRAITIYAPAVRFLESSAPVEKRTPVLLHGRYQPLTALASDGQDALTEALDTRTGRRVTLRSLVDAKPEHVSRLKREFRALQTLHHENLVRLEALFEHEGTCTIAMEHVQGTDFLSYVREGGVLNEARLRAALVGLLRGAGALHDAGFVHRDLNPTNILVTNEGRVVLLDFGLITPLDVSERDATDTNVGLLVYVAPEQVDRPDFDASADVYAIGACLYVALTGVLPFDHFTSERLLDAKRRGRPIPPFALRIEVPTDLETLCLCMLERDPRKRPSVATSLALLEIAGDGEGSTSAFASLRPQAMRDKARRVGFTGRANELAALDEGFAQAQTGARALVLVQGESGLGKTALVGEFLRRIRLKAQDTLILRSRCYANEQIAYQAFDAAVDDLAKALRRLPRDECELLLPARAALLTQLFPVLGSVSAIGQATKKGLPAEPAARKRAALSAFVALISNICLRTPMIIAIDDVQWADAESFKLLHALCGDAQGRRPFIVATRRKGEARTDTVERELDELSTRRNTRVLALTALTESEASLLTSALLGESVSPTHLQSLVQESRGHPLFLRELAAYANSGGALSPDKRLNLDHALAARFERLSPHARRLLELVALAARPLGEHVLARAFGDAERYPEALRDLLREELLRARSGDDLVCYHDRVREGVVRLLSPPLAHQLAERLAMALDSEPASDAAERARLWEQANRPAEASLAYGQAGDAALEVLAFAQAEALYARALALKTDAEDQERTRLLVQRGHALARLGRSAEAAQVYLDASQHVEGEARMRLRVSATQQQLQSAQITEGLAGARAVLAELGTPLPETTAGALAKLIWDRAYLGMRGLAVKASDGKVVSADARLRLDAAWDLAFPVVWVDMVPAAYLNAHHLRESLALGEPGHVARALAQEAAFLTMQRPTDTKRCAPLFERARALFNSSDDPKLSSFVDFIEGSAAQFRWDFSASRTLLERAESTCSEHCPDQPWLLTNARMALGSVWFNMGEHAKLSTMAEAWIDDARGRNDSFALAALEGLGQGFERHLMRDAPDMAREALAEAMAPWPREPFSFAQFGEVFGAVNTELYRGGEGAKRWLDAEHARLSRAFLIRSKFGRATLNVMQTYAALCVYVATTHAARPAALSEARRLARATIKHGVPIAQMIGPLLVAQVLALEGKVDQALSVLRPARDDLQARSIFYRYPATYLEGLLEGGESGLLKRQTALAFFAGQGWKNPRRAVGMWVPAIDALEAR